VPLDVLILDIDGTLVDSNDAHAHAWVEVFAEEGIDVPFDRVRRLIGKGGDKLVPELTGIDPDSERGKALSERRAEVFKTKHLPKLRGFPDVRALLEKVVARGVRLVVATSATKEEVDPLLEIANVKDLIDKKTSSDDAENSKPDPDIVQAALKRAKCAPKNALMLGDTPYDVEASLRAGVDIVAVRCGGWRDDDLRGALAVYDDARDLLLKFDDSPLGHRTSR
jgi:phosphoglycolate phosphatase-like HAD superfamily hydrolase